MSGGCERTPVLFVHGLGQDATVFESMRSRFRDRGYPSVCLAAVSIRPATSSNVVAARLAIAPAIERLLAGQSPQAAARCPKVHIIAHSMGALSARWFTAHMRPDAVASLITTSGANHGTNWACERAYGPGHREMCPAFAATREESSLQYALNGTSRADVDETPWGLGADAQGVARVPAAANRAILYVTVAGQGDRYILPAASSQLNGAGGLPGYSAPEEFEQLGAGNFLARSLEGHDELLESPEVADLLLGLIAARDALPCRQRNL